MRRAHGEDLRPPFGTGSDERARHGLDRAVHIALDDDVELLERSDGDTAADFVERHVLRETD